MAISIHVPREGHDWARYNRNSEYEISIHVPREGHDGFTCGGEGGVAEFLSTCPVRGTTKGVEKMYSLEYISIHVPREGHDGGPP